MATVQLLIIDRETLSRTFSLARHFLTFSWKEGARAGCLQWRTHFHCFLPSVIASQVGVGAQTGWLLTAHDRHCRVCSGDRVRGQEKGLVRTYRLDERPVTADGFGPKPSLEKTAPQWTVVTLFMTGAKANRSLICPRKRQTEHCWWFNMSKLTFIYCEANTSTVWETFINWFTVVFDMKDRASLITQRSICTLCASKSSFNNNDTVFVSLAGLDVCYSLNVLWVYGRAYGSTCRLFFFHFFCCCLFIFC